MDAPQPRMQALKICGLCGTANEPGNTVCSSCGKNGFLVQKGIGPSQTSRIGSPFRDIFSALGLFGTGGYLIFSLRGRPSTGMTPLLIGGGIVLMGIALATYAVYKFIKQSQS